MRGLRRGLLGLLVASAAFAQTAPTVKSFGAEPPHRVLYVGNSFFFANNGLPHLVTGLLRAIDPAGKPDSTLATISGAGLSWHDMEAYLRPGAIGSYAFSPDNKVVFNAGPRPFDAVIMADCSQCPIHPQLQALFHEYAHRHSETVVKHGARPVLFMTWAYGDRPEMTAQLAEQYTLAGNANNALVVPAGLAFARSMVEFPGINLYQQDRRHPSPAGSYLAACTVLAAVYGMSPVGNPYTSSLDIRTATALQTVAAEAVKQYLGH